MKYGRIDLNQIESMISKLGGEKQFKRLLDGKLFVIGPVQPWKRIRIGTGLKKLDEFIGSMKARKINALDFPNTRMFCDQIEKIRSHAFVVSETPKDVTLALIANRELGLKNIGVFSEKKGIPLSATIDRAHKLGLSMCTPEMAFELRLQWVEHYKEKEDWIKVITASVSGELKYDEWECNVVSVNSICDPAALCAQLCCC